MATGSGALFKFPEFLGRPTHVEKSGLLISAGVVSLRYWFPTFRKMVIQISSKAKQTENNVASFTLGASENCLSNDVAWNPGKLEP
jgi:hypothetical protein